MTWELLNKNLKNLSVSVFENLIGPEGCWKALKLKAISDVLTLRYDAF